MRAPLRRIYLYGFAVDFVPIAALYAVLFVAEGLSTFEISVLIATWSAAAIVFEVPSGVLADRHDRRLVLLAGQVLAGCGILLWLIVPGFWTYLFGFVLWGAGSAFHSGTFEALVYDELESTGAEARYLAVLGRLEALSLMSTVLSSLLAAILVRHSYDLLLLVSVATVAVGAVITFLLPRVERRREVGDEQYFSTLKRGVRDATTTATIARCVAFLAMAGTTVDLVTEYGPLFFVDAGYGASGVALVFGLLVLMMAISSALADRFGFLHGRVPLVLCVTGLALLAATLTSGVVALVLYVVASVLPQIAAVIAGAELQESIDGDLRATTTSVAGFSQEVLNVVGLLAFGALASRSSREVAFFALSGLIVAAGAFTFRFSRSDAAKSEPVAP